MPNSSKNDIIISATKEMSKLRLSKGGKMF